MYNIPITSHSKSKPVGTLIFFGSCGVGKTAILQQFAKGRFYQTLQTTLGVDFYQKEVDSITFSMYDTNGDEIKEEILPPHLYAMSCCFIVVISYDCLDSLNQSLSYIDYIKSRPNYKNQPVIALVNKKDIKEKQFKIEYAVKFLRDNNPNILIGEITALDNICVRKFFFKIANLITRGSFDIKSDDNDLFFVATFKISDKPNDNVKKSCCK